jgi:hypothetical protein
LAQGANGPSFVLKKSCPVEGGEEGATAGETYTIVSQNEFKLKNGIGEFDYQFCEQAALPEQWRGMVRVRQGEPQRAAATPTQSELKRCEDVYQALASQGHISVPKETAIKNCLKSAPPIAVASQGQGDAPTPSSQQKMDILGFKVGVSTSSVAVAASRSPGCSESKRSNEFNWIEITCPSGKLTVFLTSHLQPQTVRAVRFYFCDLKPGERVTLDVAQQFGLSPVPFAWTAIAAYRLDQHTSLTLAAVAFEGCTINGAMAYPYYLTLEDQLITQRDQQATQQFRTTSPTPRF